MPATLYAINKQLDYDFGARTYVPPASYYLGLSTTVIDSGGSTITEPTDGAYERIEIVNSDANWTAASGGELYNINPYSFNTSSENWGTIISVFLSDASTIGTGNIYYYYTLSPSIPIVTDTTITFSGGTLWAKRT